MKILIVSMWEISKNCIGGTERYVMDLANFLNKKNIEVDVLMLSGKKRIMSGVKYAPLKESGVKVDEYLIKNTYFPKFTKNNLKKFAHFIEKYASADEYDLVHMNSLLFYYLFPNKKRVFTSHENPFEFDHYWGKGSFEIMSKIVRGEKNKINIIAPSAKYGRKVARSFNLKVKIIPHAINTKRLYTQKSRDGILREYQLKDKLTFLVPSRLEILQKGQDCAAEALGLAKNKLGAFQVVFSGLDDQYIHNVNLIRKICDRHSIDCHFIKFEDMKKAYKIADALIIPSRTESFGFSALEGLALGIKTVMSDIPTFVNFAKNNPIAFISKNKPPQLAKAIIRAVKSRNKQQSVEWLKGYDPEMWAEKYINCYNLWLNK